MKSHLWVQSNALSSDHSWASDLPRIHHLDGMKTLSHAIRNIRACNKSPENRTEVIIFSVQVERNSFLVRNQGEKINLKVILSEKEPLSS